MKYTYLLIDLGAVLIPFLFSFHPRLRFDKMWKAFWPACFISAFVFVLWDILYTHWGVWGFNSDYLTGLYAFNLPIEEILFFICIPYACVFSYHCFQVLMNEKFFLGSDKWISAMIISILLMAGLVYFDHLYTSVTFLSLSFFILILRYVFDVEWLKQFYFTYLVMIFPFFMVNGMLTGSGLEAPVVWYDDGENLGIRLLTIPLEDIFYGMLLILLNVSIYEMLKSRITSS